MTYKGVYRDGVVVLRGSVDLTDGDIVEVVPSGVKPRRVASVSSSRSRVRATAQSKSRKPTKKQIEAALAAVAAGNGPVRWRGKSGIAITAELRRSSLRRFENRRG